MVLGEKTEELNFRKSIIVEGKIQKYQFYKLVFKKEYFCYWPSTIQFVFFIPMVKFVLNNVLTLQHRNILCSPMI